MHILCVIDDGDYCFSYCGDGDGDGDDAIVLVIVVIIVVGGDGWLLGLDIQKRHAARGW